MTIPERLPSTSPFHWFSVPHEFRPDAEAPPVDRGLLEKLARAELPEDEAERVQRLTVRFRCWNDAYVETRLRARKPAEIIRVAHARDLRILRITGRNQLELGHYTVARQVLSAAVELARRAKLADGSDYRGVLNQLTRTYLAVGDYREAEATARRLLDNAIASEADEVAIGAATHLLSTALKRLACYREAEELCRDTIQMFREAGGERAVYGVFSVTFVLASVLIALARHKEAQLLLDKICKADASGGDLRRYASALRQLAVIDLDLGRYQPALEKCKEALALQHNTLRFPDDELATMGTIAGVYAELGQYEGALTLHGDILRRRQQMPGLHDASTAIVLVRIGELQRVAGQFTEAERTLRRAWNLSRRVFDAPHPLFANVLLALSRLDEMRGDYRRSKRRARKACHLYQDLLGSKHPLVASALTSLGSALLGESQHRRAEGAFRQALAIQTSTLGDRHPAVAITLSSLAALYESMERYQEAFDCCEKALAIQRDTIGIGHVQFAVSLNNLGSIEQSRGNYEAASRAYSEALRNFSEQLPETHPYVIICRNNLSLLDEQPREEEPLVLSTASRLRREHRRTVYLLLMDDSQRITVRFAA